MLVVTRPALSHDLTDLATLKLELQITGSEDDAYLQTVIARASDACTRYCNRTTFGREEVRQTERIFRPRDGILLERDLEPAIGSVTVGGVLLEADEWVLDGLIVRSISAGDLSWWCRGSIVEIVYTAGFASLPDLPYDIEQAALQACVAAYRGRGRDVTVRTESVQDVGAITYAVPDAADASGIPPNAAALLKPWKRHKL